MNEAIHTSKAGAGIIEARETEVMRLGKLAARAEGRRKWELVSELLAFLGVIRNTPDARHTWESR